MLRRLRRENQKTYERWLDANLSAIEVLPITISTTRPYAILRLEISKAGIRIPANDAWIAFLAIFPLAIFR